MTRLASAGRRLARRSVAAALVTATVILVLLAASESARADLCGLVSCGAPVVSVPQATAVTPQSATITGSVNPNGAQTQYQIRLSTGSDAAAFPPCSQNLGDFTDSPSQTLTASSSPSPVSWTPIDALGRSPAAGALIPNTSYQVQVTATNSYGTTQSAATVFRTPLMPSVAIAVSAAQTLVEFDQNTSDRCHNCRERVWRVRQLAGRLPAVPPVQHGRDDVADGGGEPLPRSVPLCRPRAEAQRDGAVRAAG